MQHDLRRVRLATVRHADLLREIAGADRTRNARTGLTPREARIIAAVEDTGSQVKAANMLGVSRARVCHVMRLAAQAQSEVD